MPRFFKKYWPPVVVLAVLATLVSTGSAASAAPAKGVTLEYYPPLIDNWAVGGPIAQNSSGWQYGVYDAYGGGLYYAYPQLRPSDIIPAVKDTINFLSPGMSLVGKSKFIGAVTWRWAYGKKKMPKSNYTVANPTSQHPYWLAQMVNEGYSPQWIFWASGQPGQCFTVTAQGMYHKKVRRNGRVHHVWAPIPHARAQTTVQVCLPSSGGTTTTTG